MSIKLIAENERNSLEINGVTFFYRRLSGLENQQIYEQCTDRRRNTTNFVKYNNMRLKRAVLDWEGSVVDAHGVPVEFSPKLIDHLPEDVRQELLEHLEEGDPGQPDMETRQKNSSMPSVLE